MPPTTVRLTQENHDFVRALATEHPEGQSGVLNEAVSQLRRKTEEADADQDRDQSSAA